MSATCIRQSRDEITLLLFHPRFGAALSLGHLVTGSRVPGGGDPRAARSKQPRLCSSLLHSTPRPQGRRAPPPHNCATGTQSPPHPPPLAQRTSAAPAHSLVGHRPLAPGGAGRRRRRRRRRRQPEQRGGPAPRRANQSRIRARAPPTPGPGTNSPRLRHEAVPAACGASRAPPLRRTGEPSMRRATPSSEPGRLSAGGSAPCPPRPARRLGLGPATR